MEIGKYNPTSIPSRSGWVFFDWILPVDQDSLEVPELSHLRLVDVTVINHDRQDCMRCYTLPTHTCHGCTLQMSWMYAW